MAPEQHDVDKHSGSVDVWAIGIMLYEMLFGFNPFTISQDNLSAAEFAEFIKNTDITFPDQLHHDIRYSNEITSLISELLEKDPAKRIDIDFIQSHAWFADMDELEFNMIIK